MTTTTSLYSTCERLFADHPLEVSDRPGEVCFVTLKLDTSADPEFYVLLYWPADGRDQAGYDLCRWGVPEAIARIGEHTDAAAAPAAAGILADAAVVPLSSVGNLLRSAGIPVED
jgi:hypothetical protein